MTATNETTEQWAVVAVCTDDSRTSPFGVYDSPDEAKTDCRERNAGLAFDSRHVERYEVVIV